MTLDRRALHNACFSVAMMVWRTPVDVEAVERLTIRLMSSARDHAEYLEGMRRDPNIIVRAIRYIEAHLVDYPYGDETGWFEDALRILVELVCPNAGERNGSHEFYADIEQGIAEVIGASSMHPDDDSGLPVR